MGLQDKHRCKIEIAALQKCHRGYFSNKNKNNGRTIIAKNDEYSLYIYMWTA